MIKPRSKVQVQIDRPQRGPLAPQVLRAAARAALTHQAAPWPRELTIRLTGDEELRRLNREFRGHDDVTDVLSFPADDVDPETGARYLGDIALSLPRAQAQAARGGHSVLAEAQLLVVHGVLHLLGHDHAKKREQARMWQAQAEILAALGAEIMGPVR